LPALDLAGWRIELACRPAGLTDGVAAWYAPFIAAGDAPGDAPSDVAVTVTVDPSLSRGEPMDPDPQLRVTRQGDGFLLDAPEARGRIDLDSRRAALALSNDVFFGGLDYFLRILTALLAYRDGGLLVHGAGLLAGGGVHLFVGRSGSGKSTVVALSPQALALGDDLIVLRPGEAGWRAYGTPFWNPETQRRDGQTTSGRLAGIYKLVQDRDVYLEAVSPAAATGELMVDCPIINGDAVELPGLLGRCRQLAQAVPVQWLHFRKDPGFWALLRDGHDA
jgi:hypothetical protein